MNLPLGRPYRLVDRGGSGLVCDQDGVALGALSLIRAGRSARNLRGCDVRSPAEIDRILRLACGPQPNEVIQRLHRGLQRTAGWIEAGDLGRAAMEAVMLRLPELTIDAMAKLAGIANFEKGGAAWENELRVPSGQAGGGQWTTAGGGSATVKPALPARQASSSGEVRSRPASLLDDGVYRPGMGSAVLIPAAGGVDDEEPEGWPNNGPRPIETTPLMEMFPGLREYPGLAVPLAPIDGFLGISATADEANATVMLGHYRLLLAQIKAINPGFVDYQVLPPGGIAGMSWRGRENLINDLRMQRALAFYRFRGDMGPLQVETLRFLQDAVDRAYEKGVNEYNAGRLEFRLSREEAIGNYIDRLVRGQLRVFFNGYGVRYGKNENITINNRDPDTSGPVPTYRVPDAKVGKASFDWTLTLKTMSTPQVRGFFSADSQPSIVVIVRPTQLGPNSTYAISRPSTLSSRR